MSSISLSSIAKAISISDDLIDFLDKKNIKTLHDVGRLVEFIDCDHEKIIKSSEILTVAYHAELIKITERIDTNCVLIDCGMTSISRIAESSLATFLAIVGDRLPAIEATSIHAKAVMRTHFLNNLLTELRIDEAHGREGGLAGSDVLPKLLEAFPTCGCSGCTTAVSPLAYVVDLVNLAKQHLDDGTGDFGKDPLKKLTSLLYQPLGDIKADCAVLDVQVRQVRLCIEVLRAYIKTNKYLDDKTVSDALDRSVQDYANAAYTALLTLLGTSYQELRQARASMTDAERLSLALRLGLDKVDRLDTLFLLPKEISEAKLESIFGLRSTARTLADGEPSPAELMTARVNFQVQQWSVQDHPKPDYPATYPVVEPDLINPAQDFRKQSGLAFDRWTARRKQVDDFENLLIAARAAGTWDAILTVVFGTPLPALDALESDYRLLDAKRPETIAKIVALGFSLESFLRLMELKKTAVPRLKAGEWSETRSILIQVKKERDLYKVWVAEENQPDKRTVPSGDQFWLSLVELAFDNNYRWSASPERRRAWQSMLRLYSRSPIVDPDTIQLADVIVAPMGKPTTPAEKLFRDRQSEVRSDFLDKITAIVGATELARLDAMLDAFLGQSQRGIDAKLKNAGEELLYLSKARNAGESIDASLTQLSLTPDAFLYLVQCYRALSGVRVTGLLDTEWQDIYGILVQVQKRRRFGLWHAQEITAGIILGPDQFQIPSPSPERTPPPWRTTRQSFRDWQDTLRARIEQRKALVAALDALTDSVEESTLPMLRQSLIMLDTKAAPAIGSIATFEARAKWYAEHLLIDTLVAPSIKTTRLAQAIESIQGLFFGTRNGLLKKHHPKLTITSLRTLDSKWKWCGSYASWRSAMLVFLYPENLTIPSLRKYQSEGLSNLIQALRDQHKLTTDIASRLASEYYYYFEDVCKVDIKATCQVDSFGVYDYGLYLFGIGPKTKTIYWSVQNQYWESGHEQSAWKKVPGLDNASEIIGAVPYSYNEEDTGVLLRKILLFYIVDNSTGSQLKFSSFDYQADQWSGTVKTLESPQKTKYFYGAVKQRSGTTERPHIAIRTTDGLIFTRYLSENANDWEKQGWSQHTIAEEKDDIEELIAFLHVDSHASCLVVYRRGVGICYKYVSNYAKRVHGFLEFSKASDFVFATDPNEIDKLQKDIKYSNVFLSTSATTTYLNSIALDDSIELLRGRNDKTPAHMYSTSVKEIFSFKDYSFDSSLGFIYKSQKTLTVPLVRFTVGGSSYSYISSNKVVIDVLSGAGWIRDPAPLGYVFDGDWTPLPDSPTEFIGAIAVPRGRFIIYWTDNIENKTKFQFFPLDSKTEWVPLPAPVLISGTGPDGMVMYAPKSFSSTSITHVIPTGKDEKLRIEIIRGGSIDIVVHLSTDGMATLSSTAKDVVDAINADVDSSSYVSAKAGGTGKGIAGGSAKQLLPKPVAIYGIDSFGVTDKSGSVVYAGWKDKVRVRHIYPGDINQSLTVLIDGDDITVRLATDADANLIATDQDVIDKLATTAAVQVLTARPSSGGYAGPTVYEAPASMNTLPIHCGGPVDIVFEWQLWRIAYHTSEVVKAGPPRVWDHSWRSGPIDPRTGRVAPRALTTRLHPDAQNTMFWSVSDMLTDPPVRTVPMTSVTRQDYTKALLDQNAAGPASNYDYVEEAGYFVPLQIALELQQARQYTDALNWFRIVYDYRMITDDPLAPRIYDGLRKEATKSSDITRSVTGWLLDPLNPHAVAATRKDAYTRFTIVAIARCLIEFADSEFTRDTSESLGHARLLYETALRLLNSQEIAGVTCKDLINKLALVPLLEPESASLRAELLRSVSHIRNRLQLRQTVQSIREALLASDGSESSRLRTAIGIANRAGSAEPSGGTLGKLLQERSLVPSARLHVLLMADPRIAAAADALQPQEAVPARFADEIFLTLDQKFCIPENPLFDNLRTYAEIGLFKIRSGLDISGMPRTLPTYSAPTDSTSGLPTVTGGGQIGLPGAGRILPTQYRFAVLIERTKRLVEEARQMETALLSVLEKRDAEAYGILQAQQHLNVQKATLRLQDLRVTEADAEIGLAQLQQERAELQFDHFDSLLSEGYSALEIASLAAQGAAIALQAMGSALNTVSLSNLFSSGGSGFKDLASVASMTSGLLGTIASFERRKQEWQFQKSIARQDVRIGAQQIRIAQDRYKITDQERRIAEMQADDSAAVVEFLRNKFTNRELYDWMRKILSQVYDSILRQATATARMAAVQLAFERQEQVRQVIQDDYWEPPSENAGGNAGSAPDRMGLTGSARLLQDVSQLDQEAFLNNKRRLQLSKTISLAQMSPFEFQRFRETGVFNFRTTLDMFDRDLPGHYLCLIRRVKTSVIALIPPSAGIKATLSTTGRSRVVLRNGSKFEETDLTRGSDLVVLSSPRDATGLLDMDVQSELLMPFEGMGVEAEWQLAMPKPANQFDYATLADVLLTIEYTALFDSTYKRQVLDRIGDSFGAQRAYSFRYQLADQWYELHNPDQSATPMAVSFVIERGDFPPNLTDIRVEHVALYFARAEGKTFEIHDVALQFFDPIAGTTVPKSGVTLNTVNGLISTRSTNAAPWAVFQAPPARPFGTWILTLKDSSDMRRQLTDEEIEDILIVITYSAHTTPWPS